MDLWGPLAQSDPAPTLSRCRNPGQGPPSPTGRRTPGHQGRPPARGAGRPRTGRAGCRAGRTGPKAQRPRRTRDVRPRPKLPRTLLATLRATPSALRRLPQGHRQGQPPWGPRARAAAPDRTGNSWGSRAGAGGPRRAGAGDHRQCRAGVVGQGCGRHGPRPGRRGEGLPRPPRQVKGSSRPPGGGAERPPPRVPGPRGCGWGGLQPQVGSRRSPAGEPPSGAPETLPPGRGWDAAPTERLERGWVSKRDAYLRLMLV